MNPIAGATKSRPQSSQPAFPVRLRLVRAREEARLSAAKFRRIILISEVVADLLTISAAIIGSYLVSHWRVWQAPTNQWKLASAIAFAVSGVMVVMLEQVGAYRQATSLLRVRETEQVLRVCAEAFVVVFLVNAFSIVEIPTRWLVMYLIAVSAALLLEKAILYAVVCALHARGYGMERVLIYGAGSTGRRVLSLLKRSPKLGLDPIIAVDDDPAKSGTLLFEMGYDRRHVPIVEGPLCAALLSALSVDCVVIAVPPVSRERMEEISRDAFNANARILFLLSRLVPASGLVDYQGVDGILLASLDKPGNKRAYGVLKRIVDLFGALALLLVSAPIFLAVAVLVKLDSPGAALFRQERVGEDGRLFRMFKFRTMYQNVAPYEFSPATPQDPRITRVGRFLRKTSLDELPQLINVIGGSMSLVGPRPEMPFIVGQYTEWHKQRLRVKPGLTGLWQLSGDRAFLIHENIEYDLYYIENRNLFIDLAILLHTPLFAFRGI